MFLDTEAFRAAPATHVVSLGVACRTAYNLRRHFNFMGAFPFDWWITHKLGLVSFLQSLDVDYLYDLSQLELEADKSTVIHKALQFRLQHEFPRDLDTPGKPVSGNWQDFIAKPKERTSALVQKFRQLNSPNNRIAFFREGTIELGAVKDCLSVLFDRAEWTLVSFDFGRQTAFDWKGDVAGWGAFLTGTGIELDTANHKPFVDSGNIMHG